MSTAEMFAHAYADMRKITLEEAIREITEEIKNGPRERTDTKNTHISIIQEW